MDVTVIRHGNAEDRAPTDAERALSARGLAEVAAAGERLAGFPTPPDSIIASPLLRARQSAELVAKRLGFGGAIEIDESLIPDAPPDGVRDLLAAHGGCRHVLLVAHEPILSAACSLLTGTPVSALRTAEVVSMTAASSDPGAPGAAAMAKTTRFAIRFRA